MPTAGDILIGAVTLSPFGRTYTEGINEISRQERTASGRLVKDIIAKKKQFTLGYSVITAAALDQYETIYDADTEHTLAVYYGDGTNDSWTVLMEPYDRTRLILLDSGLWTGFTAVLNEV